MPPTSGSAIGCVGASPLIAEPGPAVVLEDSQATGLGVHDENTRTRDLDQQAGQRISARAEDLVRRIREEARPGLMDVFLAEYGLSTGEGVVTFSGVTAPEATSSPSRRRVQA